ncbi:hypothetical protein H4Q26_004580 [Puccinia striiformis f. sp. tritici PST-130]|nr:hypothetical protein H4Q26_004580 [Puccinia striiformis f. sp. tritici PST-130]
MEKSLKPGTSIPGRCDVVDRTSISTPSIQNHTLWRAVIDVARQLESTLDKIDSSPMQAIDLIVISRTSIKSRYVAIGNRSLTGAGIDLRQIDPRSMRVGGGDRFETTLSDDLEWMSVRS